MPARILIVDDDAAFRRLAGVLLSEQGLAIVGEAGSVTAALAAISVLHPDAVLLDVHLPDGDGLELAGRLHAAGGPRVLLTSSDAGAAPVEELARSGAAGFVPKTALAHCALAPYLAG